MTSYSDIGTQARIAPRKLGTSLRHRRVVIGGHVVLDPIALARPSMRPGEIKLLTSLLLQARKILEFGAGGSTMLAVKLGVQHITSVESDRSWIARIKADEAASRAQENGRLVLLHADIGPIGALGGPSSKESRQDWPNYSRMPWRHVEPNRLDLVLVDGRFRVACILETVLRVDRHRLIAIHDFWNRPEYHVVLPFLDEVDRCETLGVFRTKPNLDRRAARELLARAVDWPK